jgi:stearoyl-CoA desaturase (delta-9 desaturase)
MLYGLLDLPLWGYVVATLVLTHITIASVTVYLHRNQAHRALDLHPAVSHFFRFWLWLTTGMVTREWVSVHRKHHARCETPEDPHSPQVVGIRKVLWQGAELYKAEATRSDTIERYSHGTPNDWLERNVYRAHNGLGIALMLLIDVVLFGVPGLTVWAVQMIWIPFFAAGVINGLGHWWGYRNYETEDASTNIFPWGALIGGEELHNNHHAFASSAKFSTQWWEIDLGWVYIRMLSTLGLAKVRKVPPRPLLVPGKASVDVDTLSAIIANRLQVMAQYANHVVQSVYREELERAEGAYRRGLRTVKGLLVRNDALLSEDGRRRLDKVLNDSHALKVVYEYQQRLQLIWRQRTASQEKLLHALQEWCRQAEATGIRALEEFSRTLRSYSLQPA